MNDKLLDAKEVMSRLKVSRKTLYALIERGKIKPLDKPAYLTKHPKLQFRESDVNSLLGEGSPASGEEEPENSAKPAA